LPKVKKKRKRNRVKGTELALNQKKNMNNRKYLGEFIGTFFLVLTVCMITFSKVSADLQPFAIGATLMALIYSMGHISGAQFNPAVSVAFFLRGKINAKDLGYYIAAQVFGGVLAAFTVQILVSGNPPVAPFYAPPQYFSMGQAILAEVLGTFIMILVILNVATAKALEGNGFYGMAIGFVVTGMIYTFGGVSGAVFNPAILLSLCITKLSSWTNAWIYLIGIFGGAVLAAFAYKYGNNEE
jgi:aquaporin Z